MIRRLVIGAATALGAAAIAERVLSEASSTPEPIRTFVVIDAPPDRVWDEIADIEGQPRWMTDLKSVEMAPGKTGVGARGIGTVRIFGVPVRDPVTVTAFEPPRRFAIRHEGTFAGEGTIELEPGADGTTTIVRWEETIRPPVLPRAGWLVLRPILRDVFQADLHRLRRLIEDGG